jgi:hypothetical protein
MAGLIYTANFGGYDTPRAIECCEKGIDYMMFSDGLHHVEGWSNVRVYDRIMEATPLVMARRRKVMIPETFPDYDWYLWLDATMQIKQPIMPLVEKLLASPHDFAAFKHNEWFCSYEEIRACMRRKKDTVPNLKKARALLDEQKLPLNFGQAATGVLWRRNTEAVREHALAWWLDMQATTMRDQATFMLNLWSKKIYLEWIPGLHTKNKWFQYHMGHLK